MPIYAEIWDDNDFQFRNKLNLKSLPKNHLMKLDSLNFDFVEYKVVSCHIYERMMIQCYNQYGAFKDFQRPECIDAFNFFNFCVKLNAGYGMIKKYFPETIVTNPYSRTVPHFEELNL